MKYIEQETIRKMIIATVKKLIKSKSSILEACFRIVSHTKHFSLSYPDYASIIAELINYEMLMMMSDPDIVSNSIVRKLFHRYLSYA